MWLPILDISGELETLDITAELEALDLETGRAEFDARLNTIQAEFWNTAPTGLEHAVARVTYVEPEPEPVAATVTEPVAASDAPASDAPAIAATESLDRDAAPDAEPAPDPVPERAGRMSRLRQAFHRVDLRTRLVGTVLVLALIGALATVFPSVVGASVPQRHVTVTLDGQTVSRTVRAESVGDVLALEGISLHPDDRVVPSPATDLHEGLHVRVLRSFPVDVDVDGTVTTVRTTLRSVPALRRELGIDRALVAVDSGRLAAGTTIAFRVPHHVTLTVDGRTITAPRSTALDVAALLTESRVPLGPRDEVMPAPETRLTDGLAVQVFRLADDQVAERQVVPFTTEVRDDPNLPVGQTRTIQAGTNGLRRDLFKITKHADGTIATKDQVGSELLVPPVSEVIVEGTQPIPPRASPVRPPGTGPGRARGRPCAHLTLKFGTIVTLTNLATGAVAQCRVADRGPETWTGHVIDLSPDVFRRLAPLSQGVIPRLGLSYR